MRPHIYSSALAVSVLALCACSYGANAATISITSQDYTGNAPLEGTPTPASSSGIFSQSVTGSISGVELSPYAFNTGSGADGSAAATSAPYSVLDAGGSSSAATATYNVGSSTFTFLWGSPDPYNEIAFYTGANGTGSLIDVVGGETTYYDGTNLACFSSTCGDTLFDLVTFTVSSGTIGSVVLTDTGTAAFEYGISATPLPAALPLFASGLGAMGLFGWRRKRKTKRTILALTDA